tara:strand:+ start:1297 stop:2214 length:918 start_codon:yes stop_codon:yes gene_type:complete
MDSNQNKYFLNKHKRKALILAGGTGSRLFPITKVISKQLLPVYDKPMIYYPLSTVMLAGIREILIITTSYENHLFKKLLGDGHQWGISIDYAIQDNPNGLAEAFLIGEKYLDNFPSLLILGDNLFYGNDLIKILQKCNLNKNGATILSYPVSNPKDYAVAEFDHLGNVLKIEEKPLNPKSKYAIPGIYFYDNTVVDKAKKVIPSKRGELEITEINNLYLSESKLKIEHLGRGMSWLDTGNYDSLNEASVYIKTIEKRQGLKIGCPEEVAFRSGWISKNDIKKLAKPLMKSGYGQYLLDLAYESNI